MSISFSQRYPSIDDFKQVGSLIREFKAAFKRENYDTTVLELLFKTYLDIFREHMSFTLKSYESVWHVERKKQQEQQAKFLKDYHVADSATTKLISDMKESR